jgi:hypothetical protein
VLQLSGNHRIDDNKAERERLVAAGGDLAQADLDGRGVGPLRIWPGGLAFSRCALFAAGLLLWFLWVSWSLLACRRLCVLHRSGSDLL